MDGIMDGRTNEWIYISMCGWMDGRREG